MIALLITIVVILCVCGAFALIFNYSPLPAPFKQIGVWLCVVVAVIWLLYTMLEGWRIRIHV